MTDNYSMHQLKNSSFVYHMSYAHGISNLTGMTACLFSPLAG